MKNKYIQAYNVLYGAAFTCHNRYDGEIADALLSALYALRCCADCEDAGIKPEEAKGLKQQLEEADKEIQRLKIAAAEVEG
jgi:hypothetical protein